MSADRPQKLLSKPSDTFKQSPPRFTSRTVEPYSLSNNIEKDCDMGKLGVKIRFEMAFKSASLIRRPRPKITFPRCENPQIK